MKTYQDERNQRAETNFRCQIDNYRYSVATHLVINPTCFEMVKSDAKQHRGIHTSVDGVQNQRRDNVVRSGDRDCVKISTTECGLYIPLEPGATVQ